jgi:hypothetical protein
VRANERTTLNVNITLPEIESIKNNMVLSQKYLSTDDYIADVLTEKFKL